jgi:hypothetical protein
MARLKRNLVVLLTKRIATKMITRTRLNDDLY